MDREKVKQMTRINTTGLYNDLLDGKIAETSFNVYNELFKVGGTEFFIGILFLSIQTLLYLKTKSAVLCWGIGCLIFAALSFTGVFNGVMIGIIGALLLMELTGILYFIFFKS